MRDGSIWTKTKGGEMGQSGLGQKGRDGSMRTRTKSTAHATHRQEEVSVD